MKGPNNAIDYTPLVKTKWGGVLHGDGAVAVTVAMNRDQRQAWGAFCRKAGVGTLAIETVRNSAGHEFPSAWWVLGRPAARAAVLQHKYVLRWLYAHQWRPRHGVGTLARGKPAKLPDDLPGPGEVMEWWESRRREAAAS